MPFPSILTISTNCVKDYLSCQRILNLMVILGSMLSYMLRVNFTLAIVEMIDNTNHTTAFPESALNASSIEATHKFHWNVHQKNLVLGSFYWGYILTQLPGGRLAEIFGARITFGGALLCISILTLLTPVLCLGDLVMVILLRALIGLFSGVIFPAIPPIAVKWIPPLQRSKFMSHVIASALGAAFTMPLCGFILSKWGWESVFYTTGSVGLIYSIAWFYLVYDSPAQHPRISMKERQEIETQIVNTSKTTKIPKRIPWIAMTTSLPLWANALSIGCVAFALHIMVNQLPTYMNEVLHYDIQSNGLLSSLPYLAKYIMALLAGHIADRMLASGKYSTNVVRKCFAIISLIIPGLLMAVQALLGYIPIVSITMFTATLCFTGAVSGGPLSNCIDIAPNFSGTILGIGNAIATIGGWLSTFMVATITSNDNSFSQWKYVFWMLSAVHILGGIIFLVFGSAKVQSWNTVKVNETQLQKLNKTKI